MSGDALPSDVQVLLRDRINSFQQLEVLLLLRRYRDRPWGAEDVGGELRLSAEEAGGALDHLHHMSLLVGASGQQAGGFHYGPSSASLDAAVERLAEARDHQVLEVIKVMNANAIGRMRMLAINTFADAFFLGRKEKDG